MALSSEVDDFLVSINHPLRRSIDRLRKLISQSNAEISENIKWNGPNFMHKGSDRITMKSYPASLIQLIVHRGASVLEQPVKRLNSDPSNLLEWKANDRAVITFKKPKEIKKQTDAVLSIAKAWI